MEREQRSGDDESSGSRRTVEVISAEEARQESEAEAIQRALSELAQRSQLPTVDLFLGPRNNILPLFRNGDFYIHRWHFESIDLLSTLPQRSPRLKLKLVLLQLLYNKHHQNGENCQRLLVLAPKS